MLTRTEAVYKIQNCFQLQHSDPSEKGPNHQVICMPSYFPSQQASAVFIDLSMQLLFKKEKGHTAKPKETTNNIKLNYIL